MSNETEQKMSLTEYLNGVAKHLIDIGPLSDKLAQEVAFLRNENKNLKDEIVALKKETEE